MKVYKHEGPGFYIGSDVFVIARDRKQADKMIRAELDSIGLTMEELSVECLGEIKGPMIINSDNGDY